MVYDGGMPASSRLTGFALAAIGAALFSTKAIFIKLAYQETVDGALMLAWRMIFALPFYLAIGGWALHKRRARGEPLPNANSVGWAAFIGFVGYYLASQFDFAGLQYISAGLERLVLFTYPVFIMLLGWLFMGHTLTGMGLFAAAVTYLGLAIVFAADLPEGGSETVLGTALVLGAAIAFAWHHLLAKRALPALGSALFTSIALTSASVFCILHQLIVSGHFAASPRFLWLSAGCAIFATVLPTLSINAGLARTSPQIVAMISTVSPIVTIGLAVAILGENFTATDAAGAALILAGVGLYTFGERKAADGGAEQSSTDLPGDEQDVVEGERN